MSGPPTDRARAFAEHYVESGGDVALASRLAGYSGRSGGYEALKNPGVQQLILKLQSELEVRELPKRHRQLAAMADNAALKPEVRARILMSLIERASPIARRLEIDVTHHETPSWPELFGRLGEVLRLVPEDQKARILAGLQGQLPPGVIEGQFKQIESPSESSDDDSSDVAYETAGEPENPPLRNQAGTEPDALAKALAEVGLDPSALDDSGGSE